LSESLLAIEFVQPKDKVMMDKNSVFNVKRFDILGSFLIRKAEMENDYRQDKP
tara:strand:- start:821 stop:979 length:159 start_codon:yes stop_codon:yes gene_type:complete